jgi:hypothetical protein
MSKRALAVLAVSVLILSSTAALAQGRGGGSGGGRGAYSGGGGSGWQGGGGSRGAYGGNWHGGGGSRGAYGGNWHGGGSREPTAATGTDGILRWLRRMARRVVWSPRRRVLWWPGMVGVGLAVPSCIPVCLWISLCVWLSLFRPGLRPGGTYGLRRAVAATAAGTPDGLLVLLYGSCRLLSLHPVMCQTMDASESADSCCPG